MVKKLERKMERKKRVGLSGKSGKKWKNGDIVHNRNVWRGGNVKKWERKGGKIKEEKG